MVYRIAAIRKEKRMSQEELAVKSGVSRTIISGLETGTINVTTTGTLEKIARALDQSVSSLFFDDGFNTLNKEVSD